MPNPPKWAKLKPGVSLTLDKSWGQRHLQQTRDLCFECLQLGVDLCQRAGGHVFVKVAVKVDFIPHTPNAAILRVGVTLIHPGIGDEGQNLALHIVAPILTQWHQFVIAQIAVGFEVALGISADLRILIPFRQRR